ncbi:MAG: protein-L-isoaspartate(D-aspartate) O-methyltransferase [Bacteroidia bacterium]|nr:protein-L-isoaspartate(D-aspartate) O-methyltransferase [Bacteroidia bacterium]MCZ2276618.1 protein-L-isoaspartate(D-aspartate) O-methyltransferase [Bacteroidia bacterium]
MEDNYRQQGLRRKLIEEIKSKGIDDQKVLNAIDEVPRHLFMDKAFLEFAYSDKAFPIEAGQTISQPYTVAFQTHLLDVYKGAKVLEVGTGSGYQAAVLEKLGAWVFSIERHKVLYEKTRKLLNKLGYSVNCFYGDGFKGLPPFAPFDRILITCGAPEIPHELLNQLKTGGIMVVPVGAGDVQQMTTILKKGDKDYEIHQSGKFRFVPMLQEKV